MGTINGWYSHLFFNPNIDVGYTASNFKNAQFVEDSWMDNWVKLFGKYETTKVIAGVTFDYKRVAGHSTITIAGQLVIIMVLYRLRCVVGIQFRINHSLHS